MALFADVRWFVIHVVFTSQFSYNYFMNAINIVLLSFVIIVILINMIFIISKITFMHSYYTFSRSLSKPL